MSNSKPLYVAFVGLAVISLLVAACASESAATDAPATEEMEHEEMEHDEGDHMEHDEAMEDDHQHEHDDDMAEAHGVPAAAAAVQNPFADDEASTEEGMGVFQIHCVTCHGEAGKGDGPASEGLAMPPADLSESHVQELSDGALFYIVSNGRPDTPMPAWEAVLDEDERWAVVNYLRTFKEPSG